MTTEAAHLANSLARLDRAEALARLRDAEMELEGAAQEYARARKVGDPGPALAVLDRAADEWLDAEHDVPEEER